jgi:hypothetical protein
MRFFGKTTLVTGVAGELGRRLLRDYVQKAHVSQHQIGTAVPLPQMCIWTVIY